MAFSGFLLLFLRASAKIPPLHSPTLDEFLKLAAQGNVIPVTRRLLADIETPLSAYRKIRGQGESFLFESVEGGEHLGATRLSLQSPRGHQANRRPHRSQRKWQVVEAFLIGGTGFQPVVSGVAPETVVDEQLLHNCPLNSSPSHRRNSAGRRIWTGGTPVPPQCHSARRPRSRRACDEKYRAVLLPGLPRFTGGAIGFIGYEFIQRR